MRATLPGEVERFLRRHGPSTAKGVALGVRARRDDVDDHVLASERFRRVAPPEGTSPRGVYFDVSRRVLRADGSLTARAQRMLNVLRDGHGHSRRDIVAAGVGQTNNAAAELRGAGYDVRHRWIDGDVFYWIESFPSDRDDESPLEAA